jgi:hypothetical protein
LQDVKHFELPGQSKSNSAAGQDMDSYSNYSGAMGTGSASGSGTPQHMSRASDTGSDIPVKYTPVTGRISRAKKGVPVHTCDICRPAKTFTRAEHLRLVVQRLAKPNSPGQDLMSDLQASSIKPSEASTRLYV